MLSLELIERRINDLESTINQFMSHVQILRGCLQEMQFWKQVVGGEIDNPYIPLPKNDEENGEDNE